MKRIAHIERVAVIGDSLAHGLTLAATNLGINGARTWTVLKLLHSRGAESVIRRADAVVVSIGGNESARSTTSIRRRRAKRSSRRGSRLSYSRCSPLAASSF